MKAQISEFQSLLLMACEGTSVTMRDLIKALSIEEITLLKCGDMSLNEVKDIVRDLADSKDNEPLYKVPIRKRGSNEPYDDNLTEA